MTLPLLQHLELAGAGGLKLHAVEAGEGPLLLFLHGFPECCYAWHRQLAEFGRSFRAVALDLRGYNAAEKPSEREAYALPLLVEDVCCVLRALSPGRPAVLVGHDWGGIIGWSLARQRPELLDRMVVINAPHPALFRREITGNPLQMLASSYAAFFQWRGVAEIAVRAFGFAGLRAMIYGTSAKPAMFTPEIRRAYVAAWRQPRALTAGLSYYRNRVALAREMADAQQRRIDVPTLVLWGERDPALRRSNLVGLDALVANLQVRRHPTATHWIVHEEPDWVNAAIHEFVPTR